VQLDSYPIGSGELRGTREPRDGLPDIGEFPGIG
jgi:hypothetical protein